MNTKFGWICLSVVLSFHFSCNFFDPIDNPGDDESYLALARACFDRAEYDCARENYNLVSDAKADTREKALALVILAENGVRAQQIIEAFAGGAGGTGLTVLANALISTSNATARGNFASALDKVNLISDTATKGLIRFIAAVAISAAVLAENASGTTFDTDDVATTPTTCENLSTGICAIDGQNSSCDAPSGSSLTANDTDEDDDLLSTQNADGTANLNLFHAAIVEVFAALDNEIGAAGNFGSGAGAFAEVINDIGYPTPTTEHCYRQILLQQGVGATATTSSSDATASLKNALIEILARDPQ